MVDQILPQRGGSKPAVYVLVCRDGSLYTGATCDLHRRVSVHGGPNGAKYTRSRRPVRLLAWWHPATFSAAKSQEAKFKRLRRAAKLTLLRGGVAFGFAIHRPEQSAPD